MSELTWFFLGATVANLGWTLLSIVGTERRMRRFK